MKKTLMVIMLLSLIIPITGCGNKNKEQKKDTINYEVFQNLDYDLYKEASDGTATFFFVIDDGSKQAELLKEDVEEIARKNEYTVYIYDYKAEYDKKIKEKEKEIEQEQKDFQDTYCEYQILSEEELLNYNTDDLDKDENGNYIALKCSYEIANKKDPSISLRNEGEPYYVCNICENLKNEILQELDATEPASLVFRHNGFLAGDTGMYLSQEYLWMDEDEQKEYRTKQKAELERWFTEIAGKITKNKD